VNSPHPRPYSPTAEKERSRKSGSRKCCSLVSYYYVLGNIQDPDYETVTAECTHCGSLCVFNRIDDLGDPDRCSGRWVTCLECKKPFWIFGDIINPAYDLLIQSARERIGTKRYMQCIALLAQAWEMFFSLFAYSNYLYRPFFATPKLGRSDELFQQLSSQLYSATRQHTLKPLREVLINTVVKRVHPQTLQESAAAISRIVSENFGSGPPKKAEFNRLPDEEKRDLVRQLQKLKIADLRDEVVHQHVYRPRRVEVEQCFAELRILVRLKRTLPVYTLALWRVKTRSEN
jgi:hypothetical protein